MRAEFRDLAGRFFANVNRDRDHANKRAAKNQRYQPGWDMAYAEGAIERAHAVHGMFGMQKNLRHPRQQNKNENENVIAFQSAPDRFQLADFEAGQNQIFANQLLPFALKHLPIFHDHGHEEMRFQHADARTECVVKTITPRLDPEHYPNDRQIEKENDVRHFAIGKGDGDDGRAAGDRPVGRDVKPLPPNHDPPHLAAVKMRHGIDVTGIVDASLEGDGPLLAALQCGIFVCHGSVVNWITALRG